MVRQTALTYLTRAGVGGVADQAFTTQSRAVPARARVAQSRGGLRLRTRRGI